VAEATEARAAAGARAGFIRRADDGRSEQGKVVASKSTQQWYKAASHGMVYNGLTEFS
jgi:hypothetical protein